MPAAIPLRSFGTTLSATSPITGLSSPTPAPRTRNRKSSVVHSESALIPDISSSPEPGYREPGTEQDPSRHPREEHAATGEGKNAASVIGR